MNRVANIEVAEQNCSFGYWGSVLITLFRYGRWELERGFLLNCIVLIWKWKSIVTMTYRLPDIFWLLFPPFMMIHCLSSTPDWVSASVQCHRCDVSLSTKAKCIGIACNGIHEILLQSSHSCFHSTRIKDEPSLQWIPLFPGSKAEQIF